MSGKRKQKPKNRQCSGKIKYSSKAMAKAAAIRHMLAFKEIMNAYYCSLCGKYHIGHAAHRSRRQSFAIGDSR
jgi:predicted RNA-binding Zn-ribbon protein involved in translation (DUF1610 family)